MSDDYIEHTVTMLGNQKKTSGLSDLRNVSNQYLATTKSGSQSNDTEMLKRIYDKIVSLETKVLVIDHHIRTSKISQNANPPAYPLLPQLQSKPSRSYTSVELGLTD